MRFQKILSYDVYGSEQTARFDRVCSLLNQTIDPPSDAPDGLNAHNAVVFSSPRLRAITGIDCDTASEVIIEPALNEIPFELRQCCTADDLEARGSVAVREAFLYLFCNNQLATPHQELQSEFEHILTLSSENPDALAVSHTFRLRLLDVYVKTGRTLFERPESIHEYLNPAEHWLAFGSFVQISSSHPENT